MRPLFHNIAIPNHQDQVGIADGGEAVRDHEAGAPLHQFAHGLLDQQLRVGIHGTCRLVQDQHGRIGQDGTRDGQQLLLSLRYVRHFLIQLKTIAFRQCANEVIHMCGLGRSNHLFVGRAGAAVADVLHDGAIEQPCILQYHAKEPAQITAGEFSDVVPVDKDLTLIHIVEAHQ